MKVSQQPTGSVTNHRFVTLVPQLDNLLLQKGLVLEKLTIDLSLFLFFNRQSNTRTVSVFGGRSKLLTLSKYS